MSDRWQLRPGAPVVPELSRGPSARFREFLQGQVPSDSGWGRALLAFLLASAGAGLLWQSRTQPG